MKNKLIFFLVFFPFVLVAQSVTKGGKYKLNSSITVHNWNGTTCDATNTQICVNNKMKVIGFNGDNVILRAKTTFFQGGSCTIAPSKFLSYCVNKATFEANVDYPVGKVAFGLLTVPFRSENSSARVFAGGQIGGYLGWQLRLATDPTGNDVYGFLAATGGYSRIPLNNSNTTNPEDVRDIGAFGVGGLIGVSVGRFQGVIVLAQDNYNFDNKKTSRSWVSIGLGFGILKPPTE